MRFIFTVIWACILVGTATAAEEGNEILVMDFEGKSYDQWQVDGNAFGTVPPRADRLNLQGYRGIQIANSFASGDSATGSLTSPPFEIVRHHLVFLIGGGQHDGETGIELLVDDRPVRSATGHNSGELRWHSWNVKELVGKQAR